MALLIPGTGNYDRTSSTASVARADGSSVPEVDADGDAIIPPRDDDDIISIHERIEPRHTGHCEMVGCEVVCTSAGTPCGVRTGNPCGWFVDVAEPSCEAATGLLVVADSPSCCCSPFQHDGHRQQWRHGKMVTCAGSHKQTTHICCSETGVPPPEVPKSFKAVCDDPEP